MIESIFQKIFFALVIPLLIGGLATGILIRLSIIPIDDEYQDGSPTTLLARCEFGPQNLKEAYMHGATISLVIGGLIKSVSYVGFIAQSLVHLLFLLFRFLVPKLRKYQFTAKNFEPIAWISIGFLVLSMLFVFPIMLTLEITSGGFGVLSTVLGAVGTFIFVKTID